MTTNSSAITETIFSTINSLFSSLYSSVDNSVYGVLDDIVFVNTDILEDNFMAKFLGTSATSRFNVNCKFFTTWVFTILYRTICLFSLH